MTLFSLQNLFTLVAWSFFLVQLGSLSYNAVYNPEMSTVLTTEPLFPGPFPLTLQACVKPGLDEDKLTSYDYTSDDFTPFLAYLYGFKSFSGISMVVWGGNNSSWGIKDPAGIN